MVNKWELQWNLISISTDYKKLFEVGEVDYGLSKRASLLLRFTLGKKFVLLQNKRKERCIENILHIKSTLNYKIINNKAKFKFLCTY